MTTTDAHLVDRLLGRGIPADLPVWRALVDAALALDGQHHDGVTFYYACWRADAHAHADDAIPALWAVTSNSSDDGDLLSRLLREITDVAHAWDDRTEQEHEDDPVSCKAGPDDRCASCDGVLRPRLHSALEAIVALLPPAAVIRLRAWLAGAA